MALGTQSAGRHVPRRTEKLGQPEKFPPSPLRLRRSLLLTNRLDAVGPATTSRVCSFRPKKIWSEKNAERGLFVCETKSVGCFDPTAADWQPSH